MEVKFDSRTDCVFVTLSAPVSPEGLLQAFSEACDKAVERGSARLLFDSSGLQGNVSASDKFKIGETAAAQSLRRSWRIVPKVAVVGKTPLTDGFGAMVASSRGLNVKEFSEVQQTIEWLSLHPGMLWSPDDLKRSG